MRTLVSWTQYDLMIRSNVNPPVEVVSGGISGVGEDGVGNWRSSNAQTNKGTASGRSLSIETINLSANGHGRLTEVDDWRGVR